jgi:LacI family transcriptional regulator
MRRGTTTGHQVVSAAAVARAAGVSPATVSYVMNGRPGVSEHERRRILALAKEMGHRPRGRSRLPSPRRTRVIGLVVPNVLNPMFPRWAHGIVERAADAGQEVFLASTREDPAALEETVRALIARRVDGLVITSVTREGTAALRLLRAAGVPYVQLARASELVPGDFVGVDDVAAAREVMAHALGHGATRVATMIGPRFSSASAARERGFVLEAAAHGVEIPPHRRISTSLDNAGGRHAARTLLDDAQPPQLIACGSDELAIAVMELALERGLRVPGDLAVTGFDGLPHSRSALVGLTTIVQPQFRMAHASFDLLQRRLAEPGRPVQKVVLPHELWLGRTCGCSPTPDPTPEGD